MTTPASSRSLRALGLASLALAAALTAGCRRPPPRQEEIVMLIEAPVARLDPRFAVSSWELRVSHLVATGLVDLVERNLGPTPGLAEAIDREDDVTYLARLRPEARFSDGSPVTAEDVKYTFDSVRDPALGSPFRKTFDDILAGVEVVDPRSIRFRLKAPRAPFFTDLDFGIVSRRHAQPLDEAVRRAALEGRRPPPFDPVREVVGAGPYVVAARGTDAVTLARNPHALRAPATERLTVRAIRDDNSRLLALVGGSADVILNGGVTPVVLEALADNPKVAVRYGPSATLSYLGFNTQDRILSNPKVRQAIALALDRPRLIAAKFHGQALLASSVLDEGNEYFAPGLPTWPHDLARARRLLDEAGYPDPDGDGPRPRFELTWKSSAMRFRVALAQAMARQLAAVGIAVDVRPFDFATFLDDVKKGNAQLFTLQVTDVVEPDMMRSLFHSDKIPTAANNWGGLNRFRYANPALDALLDEGARHADPAARRTAYAAVQRLLAEALPMLPLWHEHHVMVTNAALAPETLAVLKTGRLEGLIDARRGPPVARVPGAR
jgi:peptide/nickel transport system substrate-binding protein